MSNYFGTVWVRADSKEEAVDYVEKLFDKKGMDLIDHRTYDVSNPAGSSGGYEDSEHFVGSGKHAYKMTVEARKGTDKQKRMF